MAYSNGPSETSPTGCHRIEPAGPTVPGAFRGVFFRASATLLRVASLRASLVTPFPLSCRIKKRARLRCVLGLIHTTIQSSAESGLVDNDG